MPVFTLLVETGRREGDGLPTEATGAALLCFASATSEQEAVDETVELLRIAGFEPAEVTVAEEGSPGFAAARAKAEAEDAVVVAHVEPFFERDADDRPG